MAKADDENPGVTQSQRLSLSQASTLDNEAAALAYLTILAALRLENGIQFHVQSTKQLGTTRDEIVSANLIGLPAAGQGVTQVLPTAPAAYDAN